MNYMLNISCHDLHKSASVSKTGQEFYKFFLIPYEINQTNVTTTLIGEHRHQWQLLCLTHLNTENTVHARKIQSVFQ